MKHKQQEKTAYQVQGTKIAMITRFWFFFKNNLATAILAVVFYTHFFLPHPEKDIQVAQKQRSNLQYKIDKAKDSINVLAVLAANNKIDNERFSFEVLHQEHIITTITIKKQKADRDYAFLRNAKKAKYFGYPSLHKFLWCFVIGLIITMISYSNLTKSYTIKEANKKKAEVIKSFMGLSMGGYFFAWVFYPANDLPKTTYIAIMLGMGVVAAMALFYISKIRHKSKQDLKDQNEALEGLVKGFVEVNKVKRTKKAKENDTV